MEQTVYQQLTDYLVAHQEDFYRLAFSYVKNRDAALDVVQESIVKALAKADTVRRPEYIKTWFYRILLNESMNHYRRTRRLVPLEDAAPEAADPRGDPRSGWISTTPSSGWSPGSRPSSACGSLRT